jgi:predicted acyl esterase
MRKILFIFILLLLIVPTFAQGDVMSIQVEVAASDGLMLIADLIVPAELEGDAPAILLIHMLGSQRNAYEPLLPYLSDAGFIVLNADMRGHGATGGSQDWDLAEQDIQVWLDWLREQDGVDGTRVAIIGGSIGGNLALIGCANDENCVTAVALSPGTDYRGVAPGDAVESGINALLMASHRDTFAADSIREFFANGTGYVAARMYQGSAHGTNLFNNDLDSVANAIVNWLDEQFAAIES